MKKSKNQISKERELAIILSLIGDYEFAEVTLKGNSFKVVKLKTREVIPNKDIALDYFDKKEGIFVITYGTCGNDSGCYIGKPLKICSGFCEAKCGKYYLKEAFPNRFIVDSGKLFDLFFKDRQLELISRR